MEVSLPAGAYIGQTLEFQFSGAWALTVPYFIPQIVPYEFEPDYSSWLDNVLKTGFPDQNRRQPNRLIFMSHLKNELQRHAEQLGFEGYLQQGDFTRLVHRYTDVEDVYLSIKSEGEAIAVKVELKPDNIVVNHLRGDSTRTVLDWSQVQAYGNH